MLQKMDTTHHLSVNRICHRVIALLIICVLEQVWSIDTINVHVQEGSSATLFCDIGGISPSKVLSVNWFEMRNNFSEKVAYIYSWNEYKRGIVLEELRDVIDIINQTSLRINQTTVSESGLYQCIVAVTQSSFRKCNFILNVTSKSTSTGFDPNDKVHLSEGAVSTAVTESNTAGQTAVPPLQVEGNLSNTILWICIGLLVAAGTTGICVVIFIWCKKRGSKKDGTHVEAVSQPEEPLLTVTRNGTQVEAQLEATQESTNDCEGETQVKAHVEFTQESTNDCQGDQDGEQAQHSNVSTATIPGRGDGNQSPSSDVMNSLSSPSRSNVHVEQFKDHPKQINNQPDVPGYSSPKSRIDSFDNWNGEYHTAEEMARAGFFSTGLRDQVKCHHCSVTLLDWQQGDDPVAEHRRENPNCTFAQGLGSLPPTTAQLVCPEYQAPEKRLSSFSTWSDLGKKQTSNEMADAGFFHCGQGTRYKVATDDVKCFCCGEVLKNWGDSDNPWRQHAIFSPACRYLIYRKGQDFAAKALDADAYPVQAVDDGSNRNSNSSSNGSSTEESTSSTSSPTSGIGDSSTRSGTPLSLQPNSHYSDTDAPVIILHRKNSPPKNPVKSLYCR